MSYKNFQELSDGLKAYVNEQLVLGKMKGVTCEYDGLSDSDLQALEWQYRPQYHVSTHFTRVTDTEKNILKETSIITIKVKE